MGMASLGADEIRRPRGYPTPDKIDQEVDRAAMTRVFNLRNVLKLVNDGLDNRALAGQQLVCKSHQVILHIAPGFSKELNSAGFEQLLSQGLRDVPSFSKDLAKEGM